MPFLIQNMEQMFFPVVCEQHEKRSSFMLLRNVYTTRRVVTIELASSHSPGSTGMVAQSSAWTTKAHEIDALRNKVNIQ